MAFDIEKEIVTANESWNAAFWKGFHAAGAKQPFDAGQTEAWKQGYRYLETPRVFKYAPRPWFTDDTRAEDERLDSPIHEPGSLP